MFKNLTTVLILLLVVVVVWVGFSVYFSISNVDINPNASSYITPINASFSLDGFNDLTNRVNQNLKVLPDSFNSLLEESN